MKVVFLKDVPKYGRRNDVKEVSDGYALNYLIPHRLAAKATADIMKALEEDRKKEEAARKAQDQKYIDAIRRVQKEPIAITEAVNEKGHLFKTVHEQDIAKAVYQKTGEQIPVSMFAIQSAIKQAGDHRVSVTIGGEEYIFKVNILKA